ncbi:MAG: exonuclease SbcCD subunit D [Planctomycetota bacterium]
MRFIHTADWHLGRLFYGVHLTDDQAHLLDDLVRLIAEVKPHALLIAGDIYDRAVPPPEAVALLDDVLSRVVGDLGVPVVMISGNHDSPDRIAFASRLLARERLHVVGALNTEIAPVVLEDEHGPVHICALPYAEPPVVREKLGDAQIQDHDTALGALLGRVRRAHPTGARSIVLAHAFIAGGEASDSERPLSVGGAGQVDRSRFTGFDYVALGHLHRPQRAGGSLHYAGSLMKYSFAEADHTKSVSLVELDHAGRVSVERLKLRARRDVRCLDGTLSDLLRGPAAGENRDDYLMVTLRDKGPILDPLGKLRQVYPNVLHLERPALFAATKHGDTTDPRRLLEEDLFGAFFAQMTGEQLDAREKAAFSAVLEEVRRQPEEDGA